VDRRLFFSLFAGSGVDFDREADTFSVVSVRERSHVWRRCVTRVRRGRSRGGRRRAARGTPPSSAASGAALSMARVRRLRPLAEAECYARCYGSRRQDVEVINLEPRRARVRLGVTGEQLRQQFAERLARRDAS